MGQTLAEPKAVNELRMLDANQIIKMFRISKTTLYALLKRRKDPIPSVKIGKSRRFPLERVLWWREKLGR